MTSEATAVTAQALVALRESARRHKRASAQHRRAAQEDMAAYTALLNRCQKIGIEVIIETTDKPEA